MFRNHEQITKDITSANLSKVFKATQKIITFLFLWSTWAHAYLSSGIKALLNRDEPTYILRMRHMLKSLSESAFSWPNISLLDFFFLFAQKKCAKAYIKSILRADKYTLPSVSVGLLPLGLSLLPLWAHVAICFSRNCASWCALQKYRYTLQGSWKKSATRCYENCLVWYCADDMARKWGNCSYERRTY